ncbi:enoyl-CoA hydratase/isomerase family protein [Arthrobacter sp. MMS18-M83]|uniref:enoyl-CoA hydratase/isomerase family protein n=1 Tax=Arthrobacter sp. MMS18-M83 TaxID=2996261 RepID=UPI00227B175A|nr:enoyl-CoA hydratase/isomerase family protein [Arthrobacter sp. MMS18-M83]WAH99709.1 enoyl-CoA hydratase/isomerase family protein [Arthrobacter sp. MMS18-M83]
MAVDSDWITVEGLADGEADYPLLSGAGEVDSPLIVVRIDPAADEAVLTSAAARSREGSRLLVGILSAAPNEAASPALQELLWAFDATIGPASSAAMRDEATVPLAVVPAVNPEEALQALCARVRANPQASMILGQTLRASETLPVPAALDVESLAYSTLLGGSEFRRWLEHRGPRPLPLPAPHDAVLIRREGDRLIVTLNRPERRNAYGAEVRDALVAALEVAVADPSVRHLVLDGAGPSFCAGGDLAEFGTTPDPATAHLIRTRGGAGRLMHVLAGRTEVRLHGHCVGAGIEIPALAGRVIADPDTLFRLPEVGMGLIPAAGGRRAFRGGSAAGGPSTCA